MALTSEQLEAVRRYDENICVIAGAGTGKTRVLVERYLRLLDEGGLEPHQLAAITFTEKAAAEMLERLRTERQEATRVARRTASSASQVAWTLPVSGGLIGRIEIPRLGISAIVVEGTTSRREWTTVSRCLSKTRFSTSGRIQSTPIARSLSWMRVSFSGARKRRR